MSKYNKIYQLDLPLRAIAIYYYLCDRSNKEGECWPAIPTIAKELNLSEQTVRRGIKDLRSNALIETSQRYRTKGGKSTLLFKIL